MRPSDLATRPVAELIPYAANSRTHSDAQIAQIAASITAFGFTNPVLIDGEGGIIAGHGRVLAAKALGLASVPVLVLDHLTAAQRRAYVIADNQIALGGGWDDDILRAELAALTELEVDLSILGFDDAELDDLFKTASELEDMPDLPSGDRGPYQQMTFTLHDDQVEAVRRAMTLATADGPYDGSPNANGNGNALARICAEYTVQRAVS